MPKVESPGWERSLRVDEADKALIAAFNKEPPNERAIILAIADAIKGHGLIKIARETGFRREPFTSLSLKAVAQISLGL